MDLPLSWHTDLAVLRLSGSEIEERSDHLLVRTPANPYFYWGNFVLVTDRSGADDPSRWLETFEREFPDSRHRAIGLLAEPRDAAAWKALDLELDHDDVLAATTCPQPTPVPQGYLTRRLDDAAAWEQSTGLRISEFADASEHEALYERHNTEARSAMAAKGDAAWFGAFEGDRLVAELGIVDCGEGVARYQAVVTGEDHRRQGLAGHLLGVAAAWAADRGAQRWVIVAEDGGDASRLYRARGFEPADRGTRAYLKPEPSEPAQA